jgi:hypothetical protein
MRREGVGVRPSRGLNAVANGSSRPLARIEPWSSNQMYLDAGNCVTCNLGKWSSILWSSDKELHRSCGERKKKESNQGKLAKDMKANS